MEKEQPPSYSTNPGYPPADPNAPPQGYPQQPAYPQAGYPPQTGYPPQQPGYPQQPQGPYQPQPNPYGQPTTVAVQPQQPVTVVTVQQPQPVMSFTGHIIFACVVFWCCGWLFGLIAFILAMMASDRAQAGDTASAQSYGRASMGLSIAGFIVGIIVIIIIIVLQVTAVNRACGIYGC